MTRAYSDETENAVGPPMFELGGGQMRALQHEVAQLREALTSSRQIGVTIGLLAHRLGCSTGHAWALLARLSRDSNVKVREVSRVYTEAFDGRGRREDAALLAIVASRLPSVGMAGSQGSG